MEIFHAIVTCLEITPTFQQSISYQYQVVAIMADVIVMNSLACRVFRLLRQLKARDGQLTRLRDVISLEGLRQNTQRGVVMREVSVRRPTVV